MRCMILYLIEHNFELLSRLSWFLRWRIHQQKLHMQVNRIIEIKHFMLYIWLILIKYVSLVRYLYECATQVKLRCNLKNQKPWVEKLNNLHMNVETHLIVYSITRNVRIRELLVYKYDKSIVIQHADIESEAV